MPELPEVEVLVRHLGPLLVGERIVGVEVQRARTVNPGSVLGFKRRLEGARFTGLRRRGKYLAFTLRGAGARGEFPLVGHLGMTGRMYLLPCEAPLPKHAAAVLALGRRRFVFEDPRYFGRLTLEATVLDKLGPEPLGGDFTAAAFGAGLRRSRQAIKVRLLDQTLVAGIGNIYASEALFRAGVSPRTPARRLKAEQIVRLRHAIRTVLREAIGFGSTVPLDWTGRGEGDRLFYYGRSPEFLAFREERLAVYDRDGQPCLRCGATIRRVVQAGRSTFYCPRCQRA